MCAQPDTVPQPDVPQPVEPVDRDSRGILGPSLLRERVRLTRYPPTPALDGLVDRFWAVRWDLPPGLVHRQQVLTHPGANLSIGTADGRPGDQAARPPETRLNGVARRLSTRTLIGEGWAVAAMTRPGGLGALAAGSAADWTDRVVPLGQGIAVDDAALLASVIAEPDEEARVGLLAAALEQAVQPDQVADARHVAAVARLAETDRSVRRLADLCRLAGLRPRTLQRMFLRYAGVSPTWVLRRYRLLDAAEAVRDGQPGVLGGDRGRARLRGPGPPDHRLPGRDRPDPGGLRRGPAPGAGASSPSLKPSQAVWGRRGGGRRGQAGSRQPRWRQRFWSHRRHAWSICSWPAASWRTTEASDVIRSWRWAAVSPDVACSRTRIRRAAAWLARLLPRGVLVSATVRPGPAGSRVTSPPSVSRSATRTVALWVSPSVRARPLIEIPGSASTTLSAAASLGSSW